MAADKLVNENRQLRLAVNELQVLNDIATTISSTQPVETIIDQIVMKCMRHLDTQEGAISLLERNSGNREFHTMIRRQDSSARNVPMRLDDRLQGWMLKNRSILLSNDISRDERFRFLDADHYPFDSILCVPLMVKGDLTGYLAVFNKKSGEEFSDEDRRLLSIIGSQSAQVLENARLYEEEKALITLQEEMKMARNIQLNLLPDTLPDIPGYQVAAVNLPAKMVGGDYYDFLPLDSGRFGFCVGDITGKGMPAAMLMANLQATIRSQGMIFEDSGRCLETTNTLLFRSTEPTNFATLFYGVLDTAEHTLAYTNGGHDAPILFTSNTEPLKLDATGLLLGVLEHATYEADTVRFQPGDLLLLYTDGITEAMNSGEEEYGLERLVQKTCDYRDRNVHEMLEMIIEDVKQHAVSTAQSDDITLLLLKREE